MREGTEKASVYEFAGIRVDVDKRRVTRGGEAVSVTPKVLDLLIVFLEHRGEVLEKEQLMSRLWPDSFVEESNLTQNVAVLRRALDLNSRAEVRIVTIPGRGYQFVGEVREINGTSRQMESSSTKEPAPSSEIRPERSNPRRLVLTLSIAGLALAGVAGLYMWRAGNLSVPMFNRPLEVDRTAQLTSWSGLDFFPAISPDGTNIVYSSDKSGNFEIYLRPLLPNAREIQISNDGAQNFEPAFSKDGNLIAYHSKNRGGIWVVPSTGGVPKQLTRFGSKPSWSPDGTQIAFQSDPLNDLGSSARNAMPSSTIWTVASDGGEPVQLTTPTEPPGGHGSPSWSPDGKALLFDVNDWATSSLWTLEISSRELKQIRTTSQSAGDGIFAPDGRSIYFIADTGSSVQNVALSSSGEAAGDPVKLFDATGTRVRQISISASGKRIVYSALSTSSNIWATPIVRDQRSTEPLQLTKNSYTRTVLPNFSPDGKRVVYQLFNTGTVAHLWTMDGDGSNQKQITSRSSFNPWWVRDGSRIMFVSTTEGSGATAMWSVTSDGAVETKLFDFEESDIYTARPSPDGKWIAFNSKRGDGILNIWIVPAEGGEPRQLTFDKEFGGFPTWSPDGHWIAYQIKRGENTYAAVIPSSGGESTQLNSEPGQTWTHDWTADSDRVVFAGQREGIWNIYAISRTTKQVEKLTDFTKLNSYVRYPAWSPLNDRIAYEYAETTGNIWMMDLK